MPQEKKILSELELGIRELFRIVVPGAYGVILLMLLAPSSDAAEFIEKSFGVGVGASFFLGLLGYALRPHERWAPYFLTFEKYRAQLNDEIARIIATPSAVSEIQAALVLSPSQKPDHVALYKLFLDSKATEIKDRIHYFSSFYYMLIELSFFSWIAAFWVTAADLFWVAGHLGHTSAVLLAGFLITFGASVQIALLYGLEALKSVRSKVLMACSLIVPALAMLMLLGFTVTDTIASIRLFGWNPRVLPIILMVAAFAFERLGAKQWKSIIGEQLVLVNAQAADVRELSKKWPY